MDAYLARAATPPRSNGAAVRAQAARVVHTVRVGGRSLTDALSVSPMPDDARDEALLAELSFGTLRLLPRLQALSEQLLQRPLSTNDQVLGSLLAIGLYQLLELRVPAHAAVSATVAATRLLRRPRAAGLINATLRRFLRERDALLARIEDDEAARYLMPAWLLRRIRGAWPERWKAIVHASNGRGPMFLRVNCVRVSIPAYLEQLAAAGIEAHQVPDQPQALRLARPCPAAALPGFDDGLVSVQDAGAQWAAALLAASPGDRVLDACAAPGGKSAHLLEQAAGELELTAIDASAERLDSLDANLRRLGLKARLMAADATRPTDRWADPPFRRILLDAPCSATGVIRRHPDIKVLRREQDLEALTRTQAALLDALWPRLEPGGRLLYVTCSLLPEENEAQISAFLSRQPDAAEIGLPESLGLACTRGRQLLPEDEGPDGFYFALLAKQAPEHRGEPAP